VSGFPTRAEDFEAIYHADGTCTYWDCGQPGVVLAYDDFSPEVAQWFCPECWNEIDGDVVGLLIIIEDKRKADLEAEASRDGKEEAR